MKLNRSIAVAAVAVALSLFGTAQAARADGWGAIAYSPSTGAYGYWYGADCEATASNGALNNCGGDDRQVMVTVQNGWAALAVNRDGGYGYAWSTNSLEDAECLAIGYAGGPGCGAEIRCWVASGV
jgi:serine/threonine-protein kinase